MTRMSMFESTAGLFLWINVQTSVLAAFTYSAFFRSCGLFIFTNSCFQEMVWAELITSELHTYLLGVSWLSVLFSSFSASPYEQDFSKRMCKSFKLFLWLGCSAALKAVVTGLHFHGLPASLETIWDTAGMKRTHSGRVISRWKDILVTLHGDKPGFVSRITRPPTDVEFWLTDCSLQLKLELWTEGQPAHSHHHYFYPDFPFSSAAPLPPTEIPDSLSWKAG